MSNVEIYRMLGKQLWMENKTLSKLCSSWSKPLKRGGRTNNPFSSVSTKFIHLLKTQKAQADWSRDSFSALCIYDVDKPMWNYVETLESFFRAILIEAGRCINYNTASVHLIMLKAEHSWPFLVNWRFYTGQWSKEWTCPSAVTARKPGSLVIAIATRVFPFLEWILGPHQK